MSTKTEYECLGLSDPLHNDGIQQVGLAQGEGGVREFSVGEGRHEHVVNCTGTRSAPPRCSREKTVSVKD